METGFFLHRRILSAVKRVEIVSDSVPYILQKVRRPNIIVVYVHASSKEKVRSRKIVFMRN